MLFTKNTLSSGFYFLLLGHILRFTFDCLKDDRVSQSMCDFLIGNFHGPSFSVPSCLEKRDDPEASRFCSIDSSLGLLDPWVFVVVTVDSLEAP